MLSKNSYPKSALKSLKKLNKKIARSGWQVFMNGNGQLFVSRKTKSREVENWPNWNTLIQKIEFLQSCKLKELRYFFEFNYIVEPCPNGFRWV
jgi:hypothetical protein